MKKTLFMIGNAHIDPVWLWRWQDGFQEIRATFRSALDRMKEFPDFVFTSACASYYAWIERNDSDMFREIQERVREGRWALVGGWWIQPDCNVPSGESFTRQALQGQRYFQEKFGVIAKTGYNVDSFGHAGTLPKILRQCGITRYVFMRPGPHEKSMPARLFDWQSPDGQTVTAYRLPFTYCTGAREVTAHTCVCAEECPEDGAAMCFYGVGNHGGGPTIENIESIHAMQEREPFSLCMASPDAFFDAVAEQPRPVVSGALLHHASGCYSAHSGIKKWNRLAENALLGAENWSSVACALLGKQYPADELTLAWRKLLFNQFHDILAGTSIIEAYEDARDDLGYCHSVAEACKNDALQRVARAIDIPFEQGARPYIAFNPQGFDVAAPCEIESASIPEGMTLVDDTGAPVPFQRRAASAATGGRCKLSFVGKMPAMGYRAYRLRPSEEPALFPLTGDDSVNTLENAWLKATFDKATGALASLVWKPLSAEMLREPTEAQIVADDSDTWSHAVFTFGEVVGRMTLRDMVCVERGPVCKTVRVRLGYENSELIQEYTLYRDLPWLYVSARVNWQGAQQALKLRFAPPHRQPCVTAQEPFGFAQREQSGQEFPMQQWVDISGMHESGAPTLSGLAILNDSKYSFDANDGALRITVLRSPYYAHHTPYVPGEDAAFPVIDQGWQFFRYALMPHTGAGWEGEVDRQAMVFNAPPTLMPESFHAGNLPGCYSFATLNAKTVVMDAVKHAEEGNALIVHMHETALRACDAQLLIPSLNVRCNLSFAPGQMIALRVPLDASGDCIVVNYLEKTDS